MIPRLKTIIEENSTPGGRVFDVFIQSLVIFSLVAYAIETLPDLGEGWRQILRYMEIVIVVVFTAEYVLRIMVADDRKGFIFSFYGLVDLIAILPFYLAFAMPVLAALGLDLRFIRVIRLLRLFRAFKILRYSKALQLYARAFSLAKEELVLFLLVALMLIYSAAAGIHLFEYQEQPKVFSSVFHSLWWAVVTLTTVGYGDIYPVTLGGRVFTFFLLLIGLGTIAVPSGIIASALGKARELEQADSDGQHALDTESKTGPQE